MHHFKDSCLQSVPEDCSLPTITSVFPALYLLFPKLWLPGSERGQHSKANGSSVRRASLRVLLAAACRHFTHRRNWALPAPCAPTVLAAKLILNRPRPQAVIHNTMESLNILLLTAAVCFLCQGEWSLICYSFMVKGGLKRGPDVFGANYF